MKNDYTEDEYKYFSGLAFDDNGQEDSFDAAEREKERQRQAREESRESGKRAQTIVLAVSAVFLALCIIAVAISVFVKGLDAGEDEKEKAAAVLSVGDEEIGADLFLMFCIDFIEGPEFEYTMKTSMSDTALCSSVKEEAIQYVEEYVCLYKEAQKAGLSMSEEEMETIRTSCREAAESTGRNVDIEEYYRLNYGVSFETYVEVRANWVLADKYAAKLRRECDLSEDKLRETYDENYKEFAKADVTMVYFDTSSADTGHNGFVKSNAATIFDDLKVASSLEYFTADELKLVEAIRTSSNVNDFYEVGENANGRATVTGEHAAKFPKLYEAVISMKPGEVRLINDNTATFIVRCDRQYLFDDCKDSEELKILTQEAYIKEIYHGARHSGTYEAEKLAGFSKVTVEDYVKQAKKLIKEQQAAASATASATPTETSAPAESEK